MKRSPSIAVSLKINISVIPRAKRNEVVERNGQLVVRVTAPAHDGQANSAVIVQLAKYWKTPKSRLTILHGASSRRKVIEKLDD